MWTMMPLVAAYWLHFLIFIISFLAFHWIRSKVLTGTTTNSNLNGKAPLKHRRLSTTDCADNGDEDDEEIDPATFPDDTPHIPYVFDEISEVKTDINILSRL